MTRASRVTLVIVAVAASGCFDFSKDLAGCVDAGACAPTVSTDAGQVCSADGWCWATRLPHNALRAIVSVSATDAWALGELGTALHYDGTGWSLAATVPINVFAAQAFGANDVYAVGGGFSHWDGKAWSIVSSVGVVAVDGSATDLWLVPLDAKLPLQRYQSGLMSQVNLPPLFTAAGIAVPVAGSVWLAGNDGAVAHRTNDTWQIEDAGVTARLRDVVATADDVWVAGELGTLAHRAKSGQWQAVQHPTGNPFNSLAVDLDGTVWAVGIDSQVARWPAIGAPEWGTLSDTTNLWSVAAAPDGVWVVGGGGYISKHTAQGWQRSDGSDVVADFYAVHGTSASEVYVVGDNVVMRFDGTSWSREQAGSHPFRAVFAGAASVWAAAADGVVYRRQAGSWVNWHSVGGRLAGIWAAADDSAWVVGQENDGSSLMTLVDRNGSNRVPVPGKGLLAIAGTSANDVWAVGEEGLVLHYDGASWKKETFPSTIKCSSVVVHGNDVWVASSLLVYHRESEGVWSASPETHDFVFALSHDGSALWYSGQNSNLGRSSGVTMTPLASGSRANLRGIYATQTKVFTVGDEGAILTRANSP